MLILKRLAVWLMERTLEGLLLGALLGFWTVPEFKTALLGCPVLALTVGVILFMHGYYVTTAFFGVIWRSAKPWLYPVIVAVLFVIHVQIIIFVQGKANFTPRARAMALPFVLGGACIVFACSFAGSRVLSRWVQSDGRMNPYVSATGITLLVFTLANVAHFLRPPVGDSAFQSYGLPFTFYREGGFLDGWVRQNDKFFWSGMIADVALAGACVLLLGKTWQTVVRSRAMRK